jgi:transposase
MPHSEFLFDLADLPPAVKYEKLFQNLPMLQENIPKTERRPVTKNSMLKALIYKSLRRFPYLADLTFELNNNPSVSKALGFYPLAPAPSIERFSSFLHDKSHHELISKRQQLVQELIKAGAISGNLIAIDSCLIVAPLKENNLKTL